MAPMPPAPAPAPSSPPAPPSVPSGVASRLRSVLPTVAFLAILTACTAGPTDTGPGSGPQAPAGPAETTQASPSELPATDTDARRGLPPSDTTLPAFALEGVVTLEVPVATETLPDGSVLVVERAGRIRVLDGSEPGPIVLDLTARTTTDGERGLLDVAVAPWGDELFVSRTDPAGDTLIEAYPLDGTDVVDAPRTVYTLAQPFANHNGGALLFLPDATLVLGLGDGGGADDPLGAGQDITTPLGGLVRLDVRDGARVPDDNPYVGVDGAARELAAIGLRNPWRMHLDVAREELWIADVGQNRFEEIDRIGVDRLLGANFGWALREGDERFLGDEPEGHVAPLHTYAHGPGCSVTGGLVYRGSALPELIGGYVFADLCDGELRVLLADGTGVVARGLGVDATRPIGFGTDADGELLVLELGGAVRRLVRG